VAAPAADLLKAQADYVRNLLWSGQVKIFLSGQKQFGADTLHLLISTGNEIVGVCCPVDAADDLTRNATAYGFDLIASGTLAAAAIPPGTDLILCAYSHDYVSASTRAAAKYGAIGYHPSLLPLHRGKDAIRWAIRMNERITGGTVYWLADTADGGDIAAQDWCIIRPGDSAADLWRRDLAPMGLRLFEKVLADIKTGMIVKIPQDETLATWEPAWERPPMKVLGLSC
jgi:methionyl-tRNA formyltransferase